MSAAGAQGLKSRAHVDVNLEDQRGGPQARYLAPILGVRERDFGIQRDVVSLDQRMLKRAAHTVAVADRRRRLPGRGRRGRALVAARRRLGPRHRHEPVRRLRLRQARRRLPRDPRHYYTGHAHRTARRRHACACCCSRTARRSTSAAPRRPATGALDRGLALQGDARRRRASCCAAPTRPRAGALRRRDAASSGGDARAAARHAPTTACATASTAARSRSAPPPGPGLNAINALGLESYVLGVVPQREPVVLAGRGARRRRRSPRAPTRSRPNVGGKGFNQYADTRSQMYRGYLSETPSTERGRRGDRGEVVTYGGERRRRPTSSRPPAATPRTSRTSSPAAHPKPWLKGVEDPYDDSSPYHRWGPFTLLARGRSAPSSAAGSRDASAGSRCSQRGVSPRVVRARVIGLARQHGRHRPAAPRAARPARHLVLRAPRLDRRRAAAPRPAPPAATRPLAAIYGSVDGDQRRASSTLQRRDRRQLDDGREMPVPHRRTARYRIHVGTPGRLPRAGRLGARARARAAS